MKLQLWWRDWSGMKKRLRRLTLFSRLVEAIDSKTVYIEANLFYLLTNAGHCARMVNELGDGGKKGFNRVDFGFDERDGVHLIEFEDDFDGSAKIGAKANTKR